MKTLLDVLRATDLFFAGKGIENSRREAERMMMALLGLSRLDLYCSADRPLGNEELELLRKGVERRGRREPLAYILGSVQFSGLEIKVDSRVLIPRYETEFLVDHILRELKGRQPGRILDLCTGSGCIALSLKKALPDWQVCASDLCANALELARLNGARAGLDIQWRQGDLEQPWENETFDLVVANPPYVAEDWRNKLEPEVQREPELALFAGKEGMDVLKKLAIVTPSIIKPGGQLWLEIGFDQGSLVRNSFASHGQGTLIQDLEGRDRFFRLEVRTHKG